MAKKLKSKAAVYTPQSQTDCAADIKKLGDLQRERARLAADMNDEIAAITKRFQPRLEQLGERIDTLHCRFREVPGSLPKPNRLAGARNPVAALASLAQRQVDGNR